MKKKCKHTVLITGASSGLGLSFAHLFAQKKCALILVARSTTKLLELKESLELLYHVPVEIFIQDLSQQDAGQKIYTFTKEKGLSVDVLINNAGFGDFGPFIDSNWEKQYQMVQVNVTSLMQLCHCYLPDMKAQKRGRILNVASIAAFQPGPLMSVYYATKAFVLSFTEALSVELKGTGISVTALCPGPIITGFESTANLGKSGLFKNVGVSTPDDVAKYGYKKLFQKKVVTIYGLKNWLTVVAVKFAPRNLVRACVYQIQKEVPEKQEPTS